MKLATTTADFYGCRGNVPAQLVRLYASTGFRCLDYSFYNNPSPSLYQPGDGWKREIEDALTAAWELGITFVQAHAPDGEHFRPGEKREALLLAIRRSIEGCAMLKIPNLVVHAAQLPDSNATPRDFLKENIRFYREILPDAERHGVNLLIENSCEQNMPGYYLRTGREMREFLQEAGHPLLHACWDTGHAHLRRMDQYQSLVDLGEELYALHIHDNCGDGDTHMLPFMGSCNFDQVLQGLKDIGYTGCFTLECSSGLRRRDDWPYFRQRFSYQGREVETLLDPPEQLRQSYVRLMYETGRYMLEQYGLYEG